MNEGDPQLARRLNSALAESRRLREENARLRRLLAEHGIPISATLLDIKAPVPTGEPLGDRTTVSGKAEQRIGLFRSLFRGREDVYAVRWESPDGRSGYAPKADRDWNAYLGARSGPEEGRPPDAEVPASDGRGCARPPDGLHIHGLGMIIK